MLVILLVPWAAAYTVATGPDGAPVRWEAFPVEATIAADAWKEFPGAISAIGGGFRAWADPARDVSFRVTSKKVTPSVGADDIHHVWMTADWPFDADVIALTDVWATTEGEIVAFELRVNAGQPLATHGGGDSYDLQAAIAHEVGHLLGFEHSQVPEATMFASAGKGEIERRDLHADDLAALDATYPLGATTEAPRTGCASATTSAHLSVFALAALLIRRRRT